MKNIQRIIALIIIGFAFTACTNNQTEDKNTISLWINSQTVDCVGVGPMKCMQVQESDTIQEGQWQNFYSKIEGFEYEEGFIYHLKVKKEELDPKTLPADASSIKYTLVEQISKEKAPISMDGKWKLISLNMKTIAIADEAKIPEIKINTAKKNLNGFSGCNRITMSLDLTSDNKIKLQPGIMTRMACPEPNYESDFMQALNQVDSYALSDVRLILYNQEGVEVLRFNRL
jgi:heat shock protein HslJ